MRKFAFFLLFFPVFIFWGCAKRDQAVKDRVYFGFYQSNVNDAKNGIKSAQKKYHFKPQIIAFRLDWEQPFPRRPVQAALDKGLAPMIVWEPWVWRDPDAIKLSDVLQGDWDYVIDKWAAEVKKIQYPIFIVFAPEFNNNDYPWSIGWNGKDPRQFIEAYRYVYEKFKKAGASNAIWVWTAANHSYPDEEWNDPMAAYPGDDFVDWVGVVGVNHGNAYDWSHWENFEDLFRPSVQLFSRRLAGKPIMIAGFGTVSSGGNVAQWVSEIPDYLMSTLSPVRAIVLLDRKDPVELASRQGVFSDGIAKILEHPLFRADVEQINKVQAAEVANWPKLVIETRRHPVTIDGVLDDWFESGKSDRDLSGFEKLEDRSAITSGSPGWKGPADLSARFRIEWDAEMLYFAILVRDDVPFRSPQIQGSFDHGDTVELALAMLGSEAPCRIVWTPGNSSNVLPQVWSWADQRPLKGARTAVRAIDGGYVLESEVPWTSMGMGSPLRNRDYRLNVVVNDADVSDRQETQMGYALMKTAMSEPAYWRGAVFE